MGKRRRAGRTTATHAGAEAAFPAAATPWKRRLALAALLCALTAAAYWPALHGGFIWDDKVLLSENAMVRAPDGLRQFWFTTEAHDYWPLTASTFWIEWRLWGPDPTGYHATNVALHALEALLLWAILARLRIGGAYVAALLFAVHPVNVESVAWITQRKNLVALLFMELAVLAYLRSDPEPAQESTPPWWRSGWYGLCALAFVLAVLGKGSAVVLPALLLLIAWWRRGRLTRRDALRIAPLLPIAAAMVAVNVWFQTHGGDPIRAATPLQRLLGAGAVVWFYLAKALVPLRLSFVYPQWRIDPRSVRWWIPAAAAALVTGGLWWRRGTRLRPLFAAWLFFGIALVPVMGLADVYFMKYALVADHYAHIALVAVVALLGAAWSRWAQGPRRPAALAGAGTLVAAYALLAHQGSARFADEETIFAAALQTNPSCWLCHYNVAILQAESGRTPDALAHYEQAVALKPDLTAAQVNRALLLDAAGRGAEALPPLEEAVRADPGSWRAHYNVGLVLAHGGRAREAVREYEAALALHPDAETHDALGAAWAQLGDQGRARAELEEALRLDPGAADTRVRLGLSFAQAGMLPQAIAALEAALPLKPGDAALRYNLAILLTDAGRRAEAIAHYQAALDLRPDYADAHNNLAIALADEGRTDEALAHYRQAIALRPDFLEARMNLMATLGRLGRQDEAVAQAHEALAFARASGLAAWEPRLQAWLTRHGAR